MFVTVPMPSTPQLTSSPSCRYLGGLCPMPTPQGVPVRISVPACIKPGKRRQSQVEGFTGERGAGTVEICAMCGLECICVHALPAPQFC